MEPTSDMRGNSYTMEVVTPTINNIGVPDQNDGDRCRTHMSCDSTDNIDEATCLWYGDVRMDVMNTHMDAGGGYSHSRYCLHESAFDTKMTIPLNQSLTGTKLIMLDLTIRNDICTYLYV